MGVHGPAHAVLARGRAVLENADGDPLSGTGTPHATVIAAAAAARPVPHPLKLNRSRSLSAGADTDLITSFSFPGQGVGLGLQAGQPLQTLRGASVSAGSSAGIHRAAGDEAGPAPTPTPAPGSGETVQQELAVFLFHMTQPHSKKYEVGQKDKAAEDCSHEQKHLPAGVCMWRLACCN